MAQTEHDPRLKEEYADSANVDARLELYRRFGTNTYGWQRWAFDRLLELPSRARILELGCGPGTLWLENRERIPADWEVTLSDFSDGMLEDARANLGELGGRFSFEVVDIQSIPFADSRFDAVIANFMLYHVSDCARALAEVRRVLRRGGRFFSATVGDDHLKEMRELIDRFAALPPRPDFLLGDARDELAELFSPITLHRFDNALVVTEAEPLVAYVLSTKTLSWSDEAQPEAFRRFVADEIARRGAIRITVDAGLFEAHSTDGRHLPQELEPPRADGKLAS